MDYLANYWILVKLMQGRLQMRTVKFLTVFCRKLRDEFFFMNMEAGG